MINNLNIGVTTVAFSKNLTLINKLKDLGFKNVYINEAQKRFTEDELIIFLNKCDIAIIGLDKITNEVLRKVPNLKVISKYGVGLDNIDVEECNKRNVKILHTQGINKRSVSELSLAFILMLLRNVYTTSNNLKNGIWNKNGGTQLSSKTIGIIGVGNIGKDLITLLQPFNCNILVNDIINQDLYYSKNNLLKKSKEEIFKEADIISIHTPLTSDLKYFIDKNTLSLMKPNAIIINTARGGLIKQSDLKWALKNNIIAGAAIDAYEIEPPDDKELIEIPNLITTPHIGGNSAEAVEIMGIVSIDNILNYYKQR